MNYDQQAETWSTHYHYALEHLDMTEAEAQAFADRELQKKTYGD